MEKEELTENELENVIGGPFPSNEVPSKFKAIHKEDANELSLDELEKVYGGPLKTEELPEEFYTEKETEERKL